MAIDDPMVLRIQLCTESLDALCVPKTIYKLLLLHHRQAFSLSEDLDPDSKRHINDTGPPVDILLPTLAASTFSQPTDCVC